MKKIEEEFVDKIMEAVEYHAVVPGQNKIEAVISEIYSRGFEDGSEECAEEENSCEDEPINYREMMQDMG